MDLTVREPTHSGPLEPLARLNTAAEALWSPLNRLWAERTATHEGTDAQSVVIDVVATIDSTNTELMRRVRQGDTAPTLLVALQQSAGRGRLGKAWASEPGASLTFSLSLPLTPKDWSGLSLAVGVGVAEGLNRSAPWASVRLKWPNDLWIGQAKLGGILVETAPTHGGGRQVVIGVGINLEPVAFQHPPEGLPPMPAIGWREQAPHMDAAEVWMAVVPSLLCATLAFERQGFAPLQPRFQALDALADTEVVLSDGTMGMAGGVNDRGELQVQTTEAGAPPTWRSIHSAEVSLRPRAWLEARPC